MLRHGIKWVGSSLEMEEVVYYFEENLAAKNLKKMMNSGNE